MLPMQRKSRLPSVWKDVHSRGGSFEKVILTESEWGTCVSVGATEGHEGEEASRRPLVESLGEWTYQPEREMSIKGTGQNLHG